MYQVQVLSDSGWRNAGAYVRNAHAVRGAKMVQEQLPAAKAVRVLDLAGQVVYPT